MVAYERNTETENRPFFVYFCACSGEQDTHNQFTMLRAGWVIIRGPQADKISRAPISCSMGLADSIHYWHNMQYS